MRGRRRCDAPVILTLRVGASSALSPDDQAARARQGRAVFRGEHGAADGAGLLGSDRLGGEQGNETDEGNAAGCHRSLRLAYRAERYASFGTCATPRRVFLKARAAERKVSDHARSPTPARER